MFGSNPFGQSSTSAFGSQPAFGQTNNATNNPFAPKPFGSPSPFGSQSGSSIFGGTSTGVFGSQPFSSALGSTSVFGASSSPAFGATSGGPNPAGQSTASVGFGTPGGVGTSTSVFGQSAANPFSSTTPANPFAPKPPAVNSTPFGSTSTSQFGSSPFGTSNPFGASSSTTTPSIFGNTTTQGFGVNTAPASPFNSAGTSGFWCSSDSDSSFEMMSDGQEPFDADSLELEPKFDTKNKYIIEERNGKFCYMAGARQLLILMRRPSQYWGFTRDDSRFSEVAVLHYGRCLDIRCRIKTRMLSPNTLYNAYLVFKLTTWSKGLQSVEAAVNFFDKESDRDAQDRACSVFLQRRHGQCGSFAERRVDGWMEVEIGNFHVDGEDRAVEARVFEFNSWKTGLIVEGIEFRPNNTESTQYSCQWRYQLVPVYETDDTTETPIFPPISGECSEIDETMVVAENEESEESEFDMSLLQEFAPELDLKTQSSKPLSSTLAPLKSDASLKQNIPNVSQAESRNGQEHSLVPETSIHNLALDLTLGLCLDRNLKKDSSLQNEPSVESLSRDELFSGSYDSLSELVNFINGMKRMLERKDMEAHEMKQKLLKSEVEAQLALAGKDSELEELRPQVKMLKIEAHKAQQELNKANEKIKEIERKLEDSDARAATAVEDYKNSEELKVAKHKFASKAFTIGFQFCLKQVSEVDRSFDTSRIDVKRLESSSFIVKI